MVARLILVLGDQVSPELASLKAADKSRDIVVMAEVAAETDYVPHHPKKIALLFSAMRHFAQDLRDDGWDVRYTKLDDPDTTGYIPGELLRRADETGAQKVIATEPGEWRLLDALNDCPLDVTILEDDRFLASHAEFQNWAEGRDALRMEWFYRQMRRKTGLLMDGDDPAGGQWNYDAENRKPPPEGIDFGGPMQFTPDEITEDGQQITISYEGFPAGQVFVLQCSDDEPTNDNCDTSTLEQGAVAADGSGRWSAERGVQRSGDGGNLDVLPGFTSFPADYVTFFPDGFFWQPSGLVPAAE